MNENVDLTNRERDSLTMMKLGDGSSIFVNSKKIPDICVPESIMEIIMTTPADRMDLRQEALLVLTKHFTSKPICAYPQDVQTAILGGIITRISALGSEAAFGMDLFLTIFKESPLSVEASHHVMPAICACIGGGAPEIQCYALSTCIHLSRVSVEHRRVLTSHIPFPVLMELIGADSIAIETKRNAMRLLGNMLKRPTEIEKDAAEAICQLVAQLFIGFDQSVPSIVLVKEAIVLCDRLVRRYLEWEEPFGACELIPKVQAIFMACPDLGLRGKILLLISHLFKIGKCFDAFDIGVLVGMLREENSEIRKRAIDAIYEYTEANTESVILLVGAGLIHALRECMDTSSISLNIKIVRFLSSLCLTNETAANCADFIAAIATSGIIEKLIELIEMESEYTIACFSILRACLNIASKEGILPQFIEHLVSVPNAVDVIMESLDSDDDRIVVTAQEICDILGL